ncbi:MAG: NifB/NifX family molybdenum-iron cluster-binding protein [Candidatus Micrarchaeia archaeon]
MKIALPVTDKEAKNVSLHFGPSPYFLLFDENGKEEGILGNESSHFGGAKLPPAFLKENGVGCVICCDMGPNAVQMCSKLGIEVRFAQPGASVKETLLLFKEGKLRKASDGDGCESHKGH